LRISFLKVLNTNIDRYSAEADLSATDGSLRVSEGHHAKRSER
jgi:hypothetical protein